MALARPLFVGFSSASKVAREGGDLEVALCGRTRSARGRVFTLPWFFVRQVDALLERWRREEHEATLLTMNFGNISATLVRAVEAGGLRDVTFLVSRGADINYWLPLSRYSSTSALLMSAYLGHLAVMTVLIDAGLNNLEQGLVTAAEAGHTPIAALLIDRGVDVNGAPDGNKTALAGAAMNGRLETARFLMDRGADVWDELALQYARNQGHEAVVALIRERRAMAEEEEED